MVQFRLFDIPVEIRVDFWLTAFLLGYPILQSPNLPKTAILAWVFIVLISVLVHEFGHALAIRRLQIEPAIALHGMGGTTSWQAHSEVSRAQRVLISLAGPFAGFALAGLLLAFGRIAPGAVLAMPPLAHFTFRELIYVNFSWGLINLLPVMPWDGGHVLAHALGPKRVRLAATISMVAATLVIAYFVSQRNLWMAMIFGIGLYNSVLVLRGAQASTAPAVTDATPDDETVRADRRLSEAQEAIVGDDLARARELLQATLTDQAASLQVRKCAFSLLAWAELGAEQPLAAKAAMIQAHELGAVDGALVGAVLFANGALDEAQKVFELLRAGGDHRKQVVGPLVQIFLKKGETARAAAIVLDVAHSLSTDDVRTTAEIAYQGGAYEWAGRLYEAVLARAEGSHAAQTAEEAYNAAKSYARVGNASRAVALLELAMRSEGFDRGRPREDIAFASLRGEPRFEALVGSES